MKQHIFFCRDTVWAQSQKLGARVLAQSRKCSLRTRANEQVSGRTAVPDVLFWKLTVHISHDWTSQVKEAKRYIFPYSLATVTSKGKEVSSICCICARLSPELSEVRREAVGHEASILASPDGADTE